MADLANPSSAASAGFGSLNPSPPSLLGRLMRDPKLVVAGGFLLLLILTALTAPLIAPRTPFNDEVTLHRILVHMIAEAEGWISFADYMHAALYAPGLGYYALSPEMQDERVDATTRGFTFFNTPH